LAACLSATHLPTAFAQTDSDVIRIRPMSIRREGDTKVVIRAVSELTESLGIPEAAVF
jgi:hypothetical protein